MKVIHIFTILNTCHFFNGQFKYLSDNGFDQLIIASPTWSEVKIKNYCDLNKVKFQPLNLSRNISPVNDLKSISKLIKIINREKPDIVVGHTPKGALVAMIAAWLSMTPTRIYFRHGLIYTTSAGVKRKILKLIEQLTSLLSTNIINVSHSLSQLAVAEHLNPANKQYVFGSGTCGGIDAIKKFNPQNVDINYQSEIKDKLGLKNTDFIIGFCGRLVKDKGINELIKGFTLFRLKNPEINAKLLLIGPLDNRDALSSETLKAIDDNPDIISTGNIGDRIETYYSIMDLFVFPSYREGFGMSVLEASAMEIPILVSHSHGCEDSIIEGVTGEYIKISPESISKGIYKMLDPNLRKIYGANGRKWVLKNFDYSIIWPNILYTYKKIFSKNR